MEKKFNSLKSQIRDVKFGNDCTVIDPSNLYECELGDKVFVGPFVEITNGVKIGERTRVSSHSFICNLRSYFCSVNCSLTSISRIFC